MAEMPESRRRHEAATSTGRHQLGNVSLQSCPDGISESSRITPSAEGYRSRFRILPWMSAPIPTRMLLELLCYLSICTGGSRVLIRGLSLRIRQGNGGNFLRMVGRVTRLFAVEWGVNATDTLGRKGSACKKAVVEKVKEQKK